MCLSLNFLIKKAGGEGEEEVFFEQPLSISLFLLRDSKMGRAPCCSKVGLHRGQWTPREDKLLINYIRAHGEGHWRSLPKKAGIKLDHCW